MTAARRWFLYDVSYRDKYFFQNLEIIRAAYEKNSGNISAIARELDISRNTVYKLFFGDGNQISVYSS